MTYNTNHMEGSTIPSEQIANMYETWTILTSKDKVISLKDMTKIQNHFTLFKYMLNTLEEPSMENIIKNI